MTDSGDVSIHQPLFFDCKKSKYQMSKSFGWITKSVSIQQK